MLRPTDAQRIAKWVRVCCAEAVFIAAMCIKAGPGRESWCVQINLKEREENAILTLFSFAPPERLNTNLPPQKVAKKCALAMQELPRNGIPAARVLGVAHDNEFGALLVEWIDAQKITLANRLDACRTLARIHQLELCAFSAEFQELIQQSNPKPERCSPIWHLRLLDQQCPDWRTQHGELATAAEAWVHTSKPVGDRTLVHGDCFSANFIASADNSVRIIDWETLALGDPMWDLAILLNADRGLSDTELESCRNVYSAIRPINKQRLEHYSTGWQLRWRMAALLS